MLNSLKIKNIYHRQNPYYSNLFNSLSTSHKKRYKDSYFLKHHSNSLNDKDSTNFFTFIQNNNNNSNNTVCQDLNLSIISPVHKKTNSNINLKAFNLKQNSKLLNSISKYLVNKHNRIHQIYKFSHPRKDFIKKLMDENKSEQNLMAKTFSKSFFNDEHSLLTKAFSKGHVKDNFNSNENLNKYKLNEELNLNEKKILNSIQGNKKKKIKITSKDHYYNNQFEAFKLLKKNKKIFEQILLNQEKELIKNYLEKELSNEQNSLQVKLMPEVQIFDLSKKISEIRKLNKNKTKQKQKNNYNMESLSPNNSKIMLNSFSDFEKIPRELLFIKYNCVVMKQITKYNNTPACRKGAKMVSYIDKKSNANKILLFGGENFKNLNDIWECQIINQQNKEKKYIWRKINQETEKTKKKTSLINSSGYIIPIPRNGHSMSLYKDKIIIYGGNLDNYFDKEDVLIYHINEKKFFGQNIPGKNLVKWRSYHISEILGTQMLIYGGGDFQGNIIAEPWVLELNEYRWIKPFFNQKYTNLPKRKFHSSCQVFSQNTKYEVKFSLFKVNLNINKFTNNKILVEGIYIFGGINENLKCTNDLLIIIRGKILKIFKANTKGIPPSPRCECTIEFYNKLDVVVLYGGRNNESNNNQNLCDLFFLDVENLIWIKIEIIDNVYDVTCRGNHCSCLIEDELIIFGGVNNNFFHKADLIVFNLNIFEAAKYKKLKALSQKNKKIEDVIQFENNTNRLKNSSSNDLKNMKFVKLKKTASLGNIDNIQKRQSEFFSNSSMIFMNKKIQTSDNFFEEFPKWRNRLQEKFKEISDVQFKYDDKIIGFGDIIERKIMGDKKSK